MWLQFGPDLAAASSEERILLHSAHTTPHTTLYLNKNREAIRQRKLPSGRNRYRVHLKAAVSSNVTTV
jgi:hypothetical protein